MEDLMQALHNLRKSLYQLTDDISEVMAELSEVKYKKCSCFHIDMDENKVFKCIDCGKVIELTNETSELKTKDCEVCNGKGEINYGMVAEGIYPDITEYYKGIDDCYNCKVIDNE